MGPAFPVTVFAMFLSPPSIAPSTALLIIVFCRSSPFSFTVVAVFLLLHCPLRRCSCLAYAAMANLLSFL